jgi:hypothetical protein
VLKYGRSCDPKGSVDRSWTTFVQTAEKIAIKLNGSISTSLIGAGGRMGLMKGLATCSSITVQKEKLPL